jgi:hypothetical protein
MKYKYDLTDEEKVKGGKIMRISTKVFNTGVVFPDRTIGSVWNEEYDDSEGEE